MYLVDIFKLLPVCAADQWTPNFLRNPDLTKSVSLQVFAILIQGETLFLFQNKLKGFLGDQVFKNVRELQKIAGDPQLRNHSRR